MTEPNFLNELTDYQELSQGEYQAPSIYVAAVKNYVEYPTVELIRGRLEKVLLRADVTEILEVSKEEDGAFKVALAGEESAFLFRIEFQDNQHAEDWSYESAEYRNRNLLEDERIEMHLAPQTVECLTYLNLENPQQDVMVQLAVLDAVAGECYAVLDAVSSFIFGGTWLAEMALSYTPHNPDISYIIHAISPADENAENDYWLHTHGLLKYGLPELEILRGNRDSLYIYQAIIQTLAVQLIDKPQNWLEDKLLVAHSQDTSIFISMKPWQQAVDSDLLVQKTGFFRKKAMPFNGDINDRDDIHSQPAMVLFANIDDQVKPITDYGKLLSDDSHIMNYLPDSETERMSALAQEKLPILQQCFRLNPPAENQEWGYIMKFMCESEQTEACEHMWFELLEIGENEAKAQLMNDPFDIPEMQKDEIYTLPLTQMTDWIIYSQPLESQITPDTVFNLRRYLNRN